MTPNANASMVKLGHVLKMAGRPMSTADLSKATGIELATVVALMGKLRIQLATSMTHNKGRERIHSVGDDPKILDEILRDQAAVAAQRAANEPTRKLRGKTPGPEPKAVLVGRRNEPEPEPRPVDPFLAQLVPKPAREPAATVAYVARQSASAVADPFLAPDTKHDADIDRREYAASRAAHEDRIDAERASERLAEIAADPSQIVSGPDLDARLAVAQDILTPYMNDAETLFAQRATAEEALTSVVAVERGLADEAPACKPKAPYIPPLEPNEISSVPLVEREWLPETPAAGISQPDWATFRPVGAAPIHRSSVLSPAMEEALRESAKDYVAPAAITHAAGVRDPAVLTWVIDCDGALVLMPGGEPAVYLEPSHWIPLARMLHALMPLFNNKEVK